jgi:hypothetical protein
MASREHISSPEDPQRVPHTYAIEDAYDIIMLIHLQVEVYITLVHHIALLSTLCCAILPRPNAIDVVDATPHHLLEHQHLPLVHE